MAKIVCEKCETVFQLDKIKGLKNCPVCNEILFPDDVDTENEDNNEPLSFGDDVELGEFDSFDEDKIDFWWYEIDEKNKSYVAIKCTKCKSLAGVPFPIAKTGNYILIDSSFKGRCCKCGNEMKNHILFKCPQNWNNKEDFKNPDLYYYEIDDEDRYKNKELRDVWCQCISCREVNTIPYSDFDFISEDYVKLKKNLNLKCEGCGKKFENIIVPKRPDGWRKLNNWEVQKTNQPRCPICNSTRVHKISMTNKAASALAFGVLAAGHVSKTYKCDICKSKF